MSLFVDTSALLAILDADDRFHGQAGKTWTELVHGDEDLVSSNYVLVESYALIQSRLGLEALRTLDQDIVPLLRIAWIEEEDHRAAVAALLTASRRRLSLVDCVSFQIMRRQGLRHVFTFDRHFAEQGFLPVP